MQHLEEGTLQALLDGELAEGVEREALRHLRSCLVCTRLRDELESGAGAFEEALTWLDFPGDAVAAQRTVRGGWEEGATHPSGAVRLRRGWGGASLARAAVLLLVFAAAASATMPGSPVRDWFAPRQKPAEAIAVRSSTAPALPAEVAIESGVSIEPAGGAFRVLLAEPSPELQIHASLVDSPRGGVFAPAESEARFRTAPGLIEVFGGPATELRIEVPREVSHASIEIDGRVYLVKEGDHLRLAVGAAEGGSAEIHFGVGR